MYIRDSTKLELCFAKRESFGNCFQIRYIKKK